MASFPESLGFARAKNSHSAQAEPTTACPSAVASEMSMLRAAVGSLIERTNELHDRLSPVLLQVPADDAYAKKDYPEPASSPLTEELASVRNDLLRLTSIVNTVLDRLAV